MTAGQAPTEPVEIVSPTTTERLLRTMAMTAMLAVFSGWFLIDGYITWPAENLTDAVEALDPIPTPLPTIDPAVTSDIAKRLAAELEDKRITPDRMTGEDIIQQLGQPAWQKTEAGETRYVYFGPAGVIDVTLNGDVVDSISFKEGVRDEIELAIQLIFGYGMMPLVAIMLIQLVRVATTKAVLDQQGLRLRGKPLIPFEHMKRLDTALFQKKGIVDVVYTAGNKEKTVRLDHYVLRDFRRIVTEICSRCGFESPLDAHVDSSTNDLPAAG